MPATNHQEALQPLARLATVLFYLGAAGLLIFLPGALLSPNVSYGDVSQDMVCVLAETLHLPFGPIDPPPPSVQVSREAAKVCTTDPVGSEIAVGVLAQLPKALLYLGALWTLRTMHRATGREGLFGQSMVRWTQRLSWWLLAGGVVAAALQSWGEANLINQILPSENASVPHVFLDNFPWGTLLAGLGVLTVSRITRVANREIADSH